MIISPNMTLEELEKDIVEYIGDWYALPDIPGFRNPGIPTFRNLQTRYGGQGIGQLTMHLTDHANVILWRGLSQALAQALTNLLVEGKIHWHVAFFMEYIDEGGPLPLPLAHWPVTEEYSKPHWLPVLFKLGASCDDDVGCPNYTGPIEEGYYVELMIPLSGE